MPQRLTLADLIAQGLTAPNAGAVPVDPYATARQGYTWATEPIPQAQPVLDALGRIPYVGSALKMGAELMAPSYADVLTAGMSRVGKMLGGGADTLADLARLTTYHGTPHTFSPAPDNPLGVFDASKIGTGEGAQVQGYGIYVTESPNTAKRYARMDSPFSTSGLKGPAATVAALAKIDAPGGPSNAVKYLADNYDSYVSRYGKADVDAAIASLQSGSVYTVDLPDAMIDRMLDWDAPLSKQPKEIVERLTPENFGLTYTQFPNGNHGFVNARGEVLGNVQQGGSPESFRQDWMKELLKRTGRDLYNQLGQGPSKTKAASEALRNAGIPGIKYLDAGSRVAGGSSTRNFVVFPGEEQNLKILKRE